jgi:D-lyxose ketol-isomerase
MRRSMMLSNAERDAARARAADVLARANIAMTQSELDAMEIADFGLSRLDETGLEIVVYVNTERVCAKELVMFPRQLCPEHRHPPFGGTPGKVETFRCRAGTVYLYTQGEPTAEPAARVPTDGAFTVWHEIVLGPGMQYTIEPDTLHWFQAGDNGAVVSEFSTESRDDLDVFTDRRIQRTTISADG